MKITLKNIAERLDISPATVSLVINNRYEGFVSPETAKKVLEMAQELKYIPNHNARSLVTGKTKIIGVTLSALNEHSNDVLQIVQNILNKDNYQMCFCGIDSPNFTENTSLPIIDVDGIITIDRIQTPLPAFFRNPSKNTPCVNINPKIDGIKNSIKFNFEVIFTESLSKLYSKGYKNPCLIVEDIEKDFIICEAFRKSTKVLKLNKRIIDTTSNNISYISQMLKFHLSASERPDFFISINHQSTHGAFIAIKDLNLHVPKDIALMTLFDNEYSKNFQVPITAIRHPLQDASNLAWEQLKKQIKHISSDYNLADIFIPYELVERKSTLK